MIITKLMGGLGNQMFQYACGRAASLRCRAELWLDASSISDPQLQTPRQYGLHVFNIAARLVTAEEVACRLESGSTKLAQDWTRVMRGVADVTSVTHVLEPHFHFAPAILTAGDNIYLEGYWQSEKYFLDQEETIRHDFTLRREIKARMNRDLYSHVEQCESVSLHIRRSDYVSNEGINRVHGLCSLEYYQHCVELITARVRKPVFFLFSDDPDWVRKNFILSHLSVLVSESRVKDYEELFLMSRCRHHIIANSSFSWWGAWLNRNPDKIVCAPERWFTVNSINTSDLIPEGWIRV
jgi:hypothetical protein